MRLTAIILAASAILLLTACANSDENLPTNSPTATSTPSPARAVTVCPRIGDGSTPTTPTPIPSCNPGSGLNETEIVPGVFVSVATAPRFPTSVTAISRYFVFRLTGNNINATLSLPLLKLPDAGATAAFFTFENGQWKPVKEATITSGQLLADGRFEPLPKNLIVFVQSPLPS